MRSSLSVLVTWFVVGLAMTTGLGNNDTGLGNLLYFMFMPIAPLFFPFWLGKVASAAPSWMPAIYMTGVFFVILVVRRYRRQAGWRTLLPVCTSVFLIVVIATSYVTAKFLVPVAIAHRFPDADCIYVASAAAMYQHMTEEVYRFPMIVVREDSFLLNYDLDNKAFEHVDNEHGRYDGICGAHNM